MQRWRWCVLLVAMTFIVALTLTPGSPIPYRVLAQLLDPWVEAGSVAFVLNVLLFGPLGAVIGWYRRPWWLLGAVGVSLTIEAIQMLLPDRNPSVLDVVTNSVGACLGYLAVLLVRRMGSSPEFGDPQAARRR